MFLQTVLGPYALYALELALVVRDERQSAGTCGSTRASAFVAYRSYNQRMQLPEALTRNVTHALGARGRAWLDALPALLQSCERTYGLAIGQPFELSYNYVAPVTRPDGTEAVLKLSPHGQEFGYELAATRSFDGQGMARLLASDEATGMALLERLHPGTMLLVVDDDDRQTNIAAELMLRLRREPPLDGGLPTTRDWFKAFANYRSEHGAGGPLPQDLFERGEATYQALLESSSAAVLLHGDLHHYNILSAQRAPWLAIDPHGLVGEPAFETGAYLGNPADLLERRGPERLIERRTHIFAERLGIDRKRIVAWGLAYQVLSAVWSAENGGTKWRGAMRVARILESMD